MNLTFMYRGSNHRPFLTLLIALASCSALLAQRPAPLTVVKHLGKDKAIEKMMCASDAGNIAGFTNFNLSSNSFGSVMPGDTRTFASRPDTVFLCFGDSFTVDFDEGSQDLSGDPIPETQGGIGYAFYRCQPNVEGTTFNDINGDPCVADNGIAPFNSLAVGIPTGFLSGNFDFVLANDGIVGSNDNSTRTIPALFPGADGEPSPVVLTIAPITVDSFNANVSGGVFESVVADDGTVTVPECSNVSIDQTVTVGFLNPISVANLNSNPSSCDGSFDVRGGISELRGTSEYTITITNQANGDVAILDRPSGTYRHNDVVNYRVPSAGTYRIEIEDAVSCDLETTTVDHPEGCAPIVGFNLECAIGEPAELVCIPITTTNFTNVSAFNFAIQYDPAILSFEQASSPVVNATDLNSGTLNAVLSGTNEVRVSYENPGNPTTIADDAGFIELCFQVIGRIGDESMLNFTTARSVTIESGGMVEEQNPEVSSCDFRVLSEDLMFTEVVDSVSCPGEADGSITITVTGGTAPYTAFYTRTIPPGPTGSIQTIDQELGMTTFDNLIAGFYEVTVNDATGASINREIQVVEGISFGVSIDIFQRPECNGDANGILVAEVSRNTNPVIDPTSQGYRIQWSTGATTDTISGLPDGTYSVTITDVSSGCTREASVDLDEPNALFIDVSQSVVDDATCSGADDGSIRVRVLGGVPDTNGEYTFNWSDGFTEQGAEANRLNLEPGDYRVTVVDVNNCSDSRPFTVAADKELIINSVVEDITCFGDNDGRISVSGSFDGAAAILPYEVSIISTNPAVGTVADFTEITDNSTPLLFDNLAPDTYIIQLRDQDPQGCVTTDTVTINEPALLEITDITTTNAGCPDVLGTATAIVSGGTEPYTFRFVNDSLETPLDTVTQMNLNTIASLQPDTNDYLLIVMDANGCIDSSTFQILAPAGAALEVAPAFVSCPGDANGQLSVVATPPTGEVITGYTWYRVNADGTQGAVVANAATTEANLTVGLYAVEVSTSNQCTALEFGEVASPGLVMLDTFILSDPVCRGDANGSIFLTPSGGTPNANDSYNYVWSTDPNGTPTQNGTLTNLTAGTYSVTITDANNCQPAFDTTFVLNEPPAITGTFAIQDVSCPDDQTNDGTATFSAGFTDGTSGTFEFTWSNGETAMGQAESTVTALTRGPITVSVSDGLCTESFTDTIGSPADFNINIQPVDVSCSGSADGSATVDVSGGTAGYSFSWMSLPDTTNTVDNLTAGTYQFEITDANGCSPGTQVFTISEPDPLTLDVDLSQTTAAVTCAGDTDGVIAVFVSSGNNNPLGDSPYSWSANVDDNDDAIATGLSPDTYSVTVTDIEGCQDSLQYTITEPEAITFTVREIEPPLCFGETTSVFIDTAFGGQSNDIFDFTFTVNNDGFFVPVGSPGNAFAGDIVVTVFDSVGCSAEQTYSVTQPPQIIIDLPEMITVELGDSLTQLNPFISPAGDVYRYLWTPGDFLSSDTIRNPTIFPFDSRDYTLTVTNQNGCQAFEDIFVEVDANRNVYIPNAFSPNRDGRNEDFRIFACQGVQSVNTVRVFDRWGGLVYDNDDISPNCLDGIQLWDGTGQNGQPVNPGVFVYMIEVTFLDNVTLLYRGDILVLR